MNIEMLKRLEKNPHYKLNTKQREELAKQERKPMVEFGTVDVHDNIVKIHDTNQSKINRTNTRVEVKN